MIHVYDFNDKRIDFISRNENVIREAEMDIDVKEKMWTYEFYVRQSRSEHFKKPHTVVTKDNIGQYREFEVVNISETLDGWVFVRCIGNHTQLLRKAKPVPAEKLERVTVSEFQDYMLSDTTISKAPDTEYAGTKTVEWNTYVDDRSKLESYGETAFDMRADYYLDITENHEKKRYQRFKKFNPLFKGFDISYKKNMLGLKREIDTTDVVTSLLCLGPQDEDGNRIVEVVQDEEAMQQFGIRHKWGLYEPQSEDQNMTSARLKTLGRTELNKRKMASVSYEVTTLDFHERVQTGFNATVGDMVRVKNEDFRPELYVDAEITGLTFKQLERVTTYRFGVIREYTRDDVYEWLSKNINKIRDQLKDFKGNTETLIEDIQKDFKENYEFKIIESDTAPSNPEHGQLWMDATHEDRGVTTMYRYNKVTGEWDKVTPTEAHEVGAVTKEEAWYSELVQTLEAVNISHSGYVNDVRELLESEYLVNSAIRSALNNLLSELDSKLTEASNQLDDMTSDTATLGELSSVQRNLVEYREILVELLKKLSEARKSADEYFKVLQNQYSDEKLDERMQNIADVTGVELRNGQLHAPKSILDSISESKQILEDRISNIRVGEINLIPNSDFSNGSANGWTHVYGSQIIENGIYTKTFNTLNNAARIERVFNNLEAGETYTLTLYVKTDLTLTWEVFVNTEIISKNVPKGSDWKRISVTFKATDEAVTVRGYVRNAPIGSTVEIDWFKLTKGNVPSNDWTQTPEEALAENKLYVDEQTGLLTQKVEDYHHKVTEVENGLIDYSKKTDVNRQFQELENGQLKNIRTDIEEAEKTITQTLEELSEKLSKSEYQLDQDNIANKFDQVETERKQLQDEISARLTKKEFERLEIGGDNLIPDSLNGVIVSPNSSSNSVKLEKRDGYVLLTPVANTKELSTYTDMLLDLDAGNYVDSVEVYSEEETEMRMSSTAGDYTLVPAETWTRLHVVRTHEGGQYRVIGLYTKDNMTAPIRYRKYQTEQGTKAKNWQRSPKDTDAEIGAVIERTAEAENKISILEEGIELKANREEVQQILDDELEVVKTNVQNNEAELLVQKKLINQKVSETKYTNDYYGIINQLNSAEAERTTMKNQISDRVTLTDYQRGMNDIDETLKTQKTSIEQNGKDIELKSSYEDINKTAKTLERAMASLGVSATGGINATYDHNGVMTGMTINKDEFRLDGRLIKIGREGYDDMIIEDGTVRMTDTAIERLFAKDAFIERLKATDIDFNRATAEGTGDNGATLLINGDMIEQRGTFNRRYHGKNYEYNVTTTLKGGALRFGDDTREKALNMSAFGISTFLDGNGEWAGSAGSSGYIQWWDGQYSPSDANGITVGSYNVVALKSDNNRIVLDAARSVAIESKETNITLHTHSNYGVSNFVFTKSADNREGYILYGGDHVKGLRFSFGNSSKLQVVDNTQSTGGDTTIESGFGEFNTVRRRRGNGYLTIQHANIMNVGADSVGDRIVVDGARRRTYSLAANVVVTSEGTLGRATSARKYKFGIENQFSNAQDQLEHSKKILQIEPKTWFDRFEVETYAKELECGEKLSADDFKLQRHFGAIADEFHEIGMSELVQYDNNGKIEGLAYDRIGVHLIPITKDHEERIEELERELKLLKGA